VRIRALLLAFAVLAIVLGTSFVVPGVADRIIAFAKDPMHASASGAAGGSGAKITTDQQPAPTDPTLIVRPVKVASEGFVAWAFLDRRTGELVTSSNVTLTNSTESMIKAWIASDYLRRVAENGEKPAADRLAELSHMIRDSDDNAAEDIYHSDGYNAVVERMIKICRLTDTTIYPYWWSRTEVSARDAVRLGLCVADGRAAGPKWTDWILNEMRHVHGEGLFGIKPALPAALADQVAIKNGWTIVGVDWHVNCLAVHDDWVLAVLNRYPMRLGLDYGADICASVATQLLVQP
jgi:hypothetical protein